MYRPLPAPAGWGDALRRGAFEETQRTLYGCTVLFTEEAIAIENCGDLLYLQGMPGEETELSFTHNSICGSHNGFVYRIDVEAQLTAQDAGMLLQPQNETIRLQMNIREA